MKICKKCQKELPFARFYLVRRKDSKCYYNSRCKDCLCKGDLGDNRSALKKVDIEAINIDIRSIYLLLKRIEINDLNMSYFDGLKLIDSYINIWGSDLKDYYENEEQLSIMYARLKQYISHVN